MLILVITYQKIKDFEIKNRYPFIYNFTTEIFTFLVVKPKQLLFFQLIIYTVDYVHYAIIEYNIY